MPLTYQSVYFDAAMTPQRVMDIFTPAEVTQSAAFFFVHGGGWRGGTRAIFHPIIAALLKEGFICATTDYRLKGVHIGDQIMDVRHGYALFLRQLAALGRPRRAVVYGSSAGAHLALLLAMTRPGDCGEPSAFGDVDLAQDPWIVPAGAAVQAAPAQFEPWEEMFPPIESAMRDIVGVPYDQSPQAYHRVSPIRHVRPGRPPLLLMNASNEHMFPLEQIRQMAEAMRQAGNLAQVIDYAPAEHGFFYDTTRPVQQRALADLLAFARSVG